MPQFLRISDFDTWRPGYAGASVEVLIAGTTTRAALYSDTDLSVSIANPQRLQILQETDGTAYGRFATPVYVGTGYYLRIDTGEQTGVEQVPLTSLSGVAASAAVATATRGSASRTLAAHLDAEVRVENFGTLGSTAATNNTILAAAIGVAAAQGGGRVMLPYGNYPFTQLSLPQDVRLVGHGRGATTLRSEEADAVITISGDGAGLIDMTLDGVNLNAGSIGILAIGRDRVTLDNVIIKRFATGLTMRGGEKARFRRAFVQNCATGADLRGDRDALLSSTGGPLLDLEWDGGSVETCTTAGLRLSFEDDPVTAAVIRGVHFDSNTGDAVVVNGARMSTFETCRWSDNTVNMTVDDDDDTSRIDENTIQQLIARNCRFDGGELAFNGLCEDVRFESCDFADVDWTLSVPTLPILLLDCTEDSASTASGALDRLMRESSHKRGEFPGVTTDATWTTAWQSELEPGEIMRIRARVLGRRRDGEEWFSSGLTASFQRTGSSLAFAAASATLVAGTVVTGGTSGATARVSAVSGTTSGTIVLRDITGAFVNGEALTFSDGKSATASSTLVPGTLYLDPSWWAKDSLDTKTDSDWDIRAAVSSNSATVQVKGDASQVVEWLVEVDVLRP